MPIKKYGRKRRATKRSMSRRPYRKSTGLRKRTYRKKPFSINKVKVHNLVVGVTQVHRKAPRYTLAALRRFRVAVNNVWYFNYSFQVAALTGKQGAADVGWFSTTQLRNIYDQLNPQANTIGGTGNIANVARWFLKNAYVQMTMVNSSNTYANVDIYEWVCKQNAEYAPNQLWINSLSNGFNGGATATTEIPGQSMVDGITSIGVYWKLNRIDKLVLAPGQSHQHNLSSENNTTIINSLIDGNATHDFCRGISRVFSFVAYGSPVTSTLPAGAVSTSPIALDVIFSMRANVKFLTDDLVTQRITNNLNTTGTYSSYNSGSGVFNAPAKV